jgi:hypothetical protein
MAQIANTTRLWKTTNIEYSPYLVGFTWTTRSRSVTSYHGRCMMTDNSYPVAAITAGTRLVSQATSPLENGWYEYTETSVTEGAWSI